MRIIGLWNGDYLRGIGSYQSMAEAIMLPYNSETNFSGTVTPASAQHLSVARTINGSTRYGLSLKPSGTYNQDLSICLVFPALNELTAFKTAGVKKHYIGVRVIPQNVATGGKLLHFGARTDAYVTATPGVECFIEIVSDLTTNTRQTYVNGSAFLNTTELANVADRVHIGNYSSTVNKLLTAASHNFDVIDIYVAVAETDEDAAVPRLGKMHIKTATLSSVTNDAKFTPVSTNNATIPKILSVYRDAAGSTGTYVLTDSGQSKMALHWDKPTDGTEVLGAVLQVATMKPASAQAKTVVSMGDVKVKPTMYPDTATWLAYQPASIPTPEGGWSEDAIANLDIKIGSERVL